MKENTQLIYHNPPLSFGDCWRTCISCILDLEPEDVPHFLIDGCQNDTALFRARPWFRERGLEIITISMDSSASFDMCNLMFGDSLYILTGESNNYRESAHCVIATGHFKMIWDVSPKRDGAPPKPFKENGFYCLDFIVRS